MTRKPNGVFLLKLERRLVNRLNKRFKKQMDFVISGLDRFTQLEKNTIQKNDIIAQIQDLLASMPEKDGISEDIVGVMTTAIHRGGRYITQKLKLGKFGVSYSLENAEAKQFLKGKLSHELSNYKGSIHSTTVERISEILRKAIESGQSYSKTAAQIREQGKAGVFSKKRGELIATREVGVAYEKGNKIPLDEFHVRHPSQTVQKAWETVGDSKVTEECRANAAKGWLDYSSKFTAKDDGKDSDEIAPRYRNPRCRCFTKYQIL